MLRVKRVKHKEVKKLLKKSHINRDREFGFIQPR